MASSSRTEVTTGGPKFVLAEVANIMPDLKNSHGLVIVTFEDSMIPYTQKQVGGLLYDCAGFLYNNSLVELDSLGIHVLGENEPQKKVNKIIAAIRLCNFILLSKRHVLFKPDALALRARAVKELLTLSGIVDTTPPKERDSLLLLVDRLMPSLMDENNEEIAVFDKILIPRNKEEVFKKFALCIHYLKSIGNWKALEQVGITIRRGAIPSSQQLNRFYTICALINFVKEKLSWELSEEWLKLQNEAEAGIQSILHAQRLVNNKSTFKFGEHKRGALPLPAPMVKLPPRHPV